MTSASAPLDTRASRRALREAQEVREKPNPSSAPVPAPTTSRVHMAIRWALALVFAAAAVAAVAFEHTLRTMEAAISAELLPLIFATGTKAATSSGSPAIAFEGDGHWYALRITAECAIAFYVAAIFALTAILLLLPRFPLVRMLGATAIGVTGLVFLNQVRLGWLAYAFSYQSREVFDWVHIVGGTMLMAVSMAATLLFYVLFIVRKPKKK